MKTAFRFNRLSGTGQRRIMLLTNATPKLRRKLRERAQRRARHAIQ